MSLLGCVSLSERVSASGCVSLNGCVSVSGCVSVNPHALLSGCVSSVSSTEGQHCIFHYTWGTSQARSLIVLCNLLDNILSTAALFLFPPLRSNCRVLLATVSPVLGTLLYSCVLNGTRNLAYRTSRFLRLCLRCVMVCGVVLCDGVWCGAV